MERPYSPFIAILVSLVFIFLLNGCKSEPDNPLSVFRQCSEFAQAGNLDAMTARLTGKSLRNWTHNPEQQLERAKKRFPYNIRTLEIRKQDANAAKLHWTGLVGDTDGEVSGYYDMSFEDDIWKCTGIGSWYRQTK